MQIDNTLNHCLFEMLHFHVDISEKSVSFLCSGIHFIQELENIFTALHCHLLESQFFCFHEIVSRHCLGEVENVFNHFEANFFRDTVQQILSESAKLCMRYEKNICAYILLRLGIGIFTKHNHQVLQGVMRHYLGKVGT